MKTQELQEIDLLLGNGAAINIGPQTFQLQRMNLGRVLAISRAALLTEINTEALESGNTEQQMAEQFAIVDRNTELQAEIIALALVSEYKDKEKVDEVKNLALEHLTSSDALSIVSQIIKTADFENFTISTFLINGNPRPTQAKKVEG